MRQKGVHPGYVAYTIETVVAKDSLGVVHVSFRLPSSTDEEAASKMSESHGLVEGVHAMIVQALHLETLVQMEGFKKAGFSVDSAVESVRSVLMTTIDGMAPKIVAQVMETVKSEYKA